MKKKLVEKLKPTGTRKSGDVVTTQVKDGILILNLYKDKKLYGRYCMNVDTGEYADVNEKNIWGTRKLENIMDSNAYNPWTPVNKKVRFDTKEDEERILKALLHETEGSTWSRISSMETRYNIDCNARKEDSKQRRIEEEINAIPPLPDMEDWVNKLIDGKDYAFWDRESGDYCCTACGKTYSITEKWKNNQKATCPACGKEIVVKKQAKRIHIPAQVMVVQNVDEYRTAIRFVDVRMEWNAGYKRYLNTSVAMVIMAYKQRHKLRRNISYRLYYNQSAKLDDFGDDRYRGHYGWRRRDGFWDGNPGSRRTGKCYLYPDGVEALDGTIYERWTRTFEQMAAGLHPFYYNQFLMSCYVTQNLVPMTEYLYKGRFYKLLSEVSARIWPTMNWQQVSYYGDLNPEGQTIEEVFNIDDRQVINRLRDMNGGLDIYYWLKLTHEEGWKISQETLTWLTKGNISMSTVGFILGKMSLQQIMNYVKRQQKESYSGKSAKEVLIQWNDYMQMCKRLHRKVDDEMIYRPRELKRRHDEAVVELEAREAKIEADEYSEKYPEAEAVLREVKDKFEYIGEEYFIKVPDRIVDIVIEGRCLHHCVASSDRYLERMRDNETYICFLRKIEEPNTPYYTIEVEPGGTIRQHRGYLDEEPEFDKVKPFLQEWQRVIKQRMKKEDHELAKRSRAKREANTEDLIRRNNLKVLKGLEEDFMDAEAV